MLRLWIFLMTGGAYSLLSQFFLSFLISAAFLRSVKIHALEAQAKVRKPADAVLNTAAGKGAAAPL